MFKLSRSKVYELTGVPENTLTNMTTQNKIRSGRNKAGTVFEPIYKITKNETKDGCKGYMSFTGVDLTIVRALYDIQFLHSSVRRKIGKDLKRQMMNGVTRQDQVVDIEISKNVIIKLKLNVYNI